MRNLEGKIALVAGGTRGAGRGIATMLGEAGATVYVTGRSTRGNLSDYGREETIDETAEMVSARGGIGIPVRVDHTKEDEVKALFERIGREQDGRLDILINDVWGGDPLAEWYVPFWKHNLKNGLLMQHRAVHTHIITSHYGAELMVKRNQGIIIEMTDGLDYTYRGSLYYSLAKISSIHLAQAMAKDFLDNNIEITSFALTPGYLRSEAILDGFGVKEENWQDAIAKDPGFGNSETPYYVGRAVVALVSDPNIKQRAGKVFSSGWLAREYGFTDVDGRLPNGY